MPVPHDGALLGWVIDSQVTVLLAVYCKQPATWDDPAPAPRDPGHADGSTSELLPWPPFTASPLDDGRLWEYAERGQIVDIVPLVTQSAGCAFWVPSRDRRSVRHEEGCVVIADHLPADRVLASAGVYIDHWTLREGILPPPADRLLAWPTSSTWPTGFAGREV